MKLSKLIKEERILVDLPGERLSDGVDALLKALEPELGKEGLQLARQGLEARRGDTSDYVGSGVAVPHARIEGLKDFYIVVGNSSKGLTLDTGPANGGGDKTAGDAPPEKVHLVFLILTPLVQITLMLQTLAAIARLCHNNDTRRALRDCKTPGRILRLIEESAVEVKRTVTASDAMRTCEITLSPDDDLSTALRKMVRSDEAVLPVLDADRKLVGCLSPSAFFQLGMPKYLNFLSDVDFLKSFEPFEEVLANEKKMKTSQIATADAPAVTAETPILLVAHTMVKRPTPTVFVVDDKGRLKGLIHESDILAKVLMP